MKQFRESKKLSAEESYLEFEDERDEKDEKYTHVQIQRKKSGKMKSKMHMKTQKKRRKKTQSKAI